MSNAQFSVFDVFYLFCEDPLECVNQAFAISCFVNTLNKVRDRKRNVYGKSEVFGFPTLLNFIALCG